MILDFHTHCFPDALAPKALSALIQNGSSMDLRPYTDGTANGLRHNMQLNGIDRSVVCNIATNDRQMIKVNDFAIDTLRRFNDLIPLGSLHPHADGLEEEFNRLIQAGIRGIKVHPDYTHIDFDSPDFELIFALCEAKNVFVITHAGYDPVSPDHVHCSPDKVRRVMDMFPRLKLVVAHAGGLNCEEETLSQLCGQNIWMDTSLLTYRSEKAALMRDIFRSHNPRKLLFATDTPWTNAADEISAIQTMDIPEKLKENIFSENAFSLLSSVNYKGYGI